MGAYVEGRNNELYDPVTGEQVGYKDRNGVERLILSAAQASAMVAYLNAGAIGSSSLPKTKKGLARVRARTGRMNVLDIGDSTTAGAGSNGTGGGLRSLSYPALLAAELTARGYPAISSSMFATAGATSLANWLTYDPRFTAGAGWVQNGSTTVGGRFLSNSTDTSTLAFTPLEQWDTAEVWYFQNTGNATVTANKDGGATLATINMAGASSVVKATISTGGAAATGTLNLQRNGTGAGAFILAMNLFDSATPSISMWNAGWSSSSVVDWIGTSGPYGPLTMIGILAPDLTILDLGINDWNGGTTVALYTSRMQSIISAALVSGDVILKIGVQSNPAAFATLARQQQFIDVINSLAVTNNLQEFDSNAALGGFVAAQAAGYMYDDRHCLALGYATMTPPLATRILANI